MHAVNKYYLNIKEKNGEQCEMEENRGYGENLPYKYFETNFSFPRETLKLYFHAYLTSMGVLEN